MSKKAFIFGLFVAVLASSVGGAFATSIAHADTIYPYAGLGCNPMVQSANSGDLIGFYVSYNAPFMTPVNGQFTWQAVGGSPSTGTGSYFSTRFYTVSVNTTQVVTVTDGYQTASCTVFVNGNGIVTPTPTPTPIYSTVTCTPSYTYGPSGTAFSFTALGGNGFYNWTVDGVTQSTSNATLWATLYNGTSSDRYVLVSVTSAGFTSSCQVRVTPHTVTPTPTIYPTPYPTVTPCPAYCAAQGLSLSIAGRNVTRGQSGEYASVVARGNDTVDIVLRIRNTNSWNLSNVFVTDMLPTGLRYIARSTTVNGSVVVDGITTSGLNIGTMSPNQEVVVKLSAMVDPTAVPGWGQVNLFNTAQVRADGVTTISARLPVTLGNAASLAAISRIKTGPADSILLAFLISVVATGLAAMYMTREQSAVWAPNFIQ